MDRDATAVALSKRIAAGDLADGFTAYDVRRKCWAGLTTQEDVSRAIDALCEAGWIRPASEERTTRGRKTVRYDINPKVVAP